LKWLRCEALALQVHFATMAIPTAVTQQSQASEEKRVHDSGVTKGKSRFTQASFNSTPSAPTSDTSRVSSDIADDDDDTQSISGQRNSMSPAQLRIAIPTLSICLFVSFIDQTSVSTATPAIAGDLNTGPATSWIGTSFLIASTAFQLINGRLSDIFGRKGLLLLCLAILALGDLGCGFAQTAEQLFVLRAIAGIGGGGINSLVMIIVSDITTLENRGKYQGE
jgi:hypothetical protein